MKVWITSDQHFYHANILNFTDDEENRIRPGFADVHEMNRYMINRWNSKVAHEDKVYHLGDIVMKDSAWAFEEIMPQLRGNIVLIKGNHDNAKLHTYTRYFRDIRSEVALKTSRGRPVIFTHRPVRLPNVGVFNVHGHLHQRILPDSRYYNACVEVQNYEPVLWDDLNAILDRRVDAV